MDEHPPRFGLALPLLVNQLIHEAEQYYSEHEKLSDELLQSFHSFFGDTFVRAVEMLESSKGRFVEYKTASGVRSVYKIGVNRDYTLLPGINFCFCPAFHYKVLQAGDVLTCKHVLAGVLGNIYKRMKVEVITDGQVVDILNDLQEM